jgi:hypothetical protein
MAVGAVFADILDEKLGGCAETGRHSDPPTPRFIPPHPLQFATPLQRFRVSPYRVTAARSGGAYQRSPTPRTPPAPVRPPRTLTARQRQALDAFVMLGARVTAGSTPSELRRAFRLLALTYHPDRHPDASEGERARLTRLLADLNEHHRHLIAAF